MASRLNVTNIEFAQVDLLQIGSLGRRFHLIECMGVLHHLADPLEGWKVLVNCLKPQGLMRVGLYSEIAREMVAHARRRIHASGLKADAPDDIRGFRKAYLGGEFPALQGLTQWRDFFSLSECRDLLFHHTEHSYTIEKLRSQLDQLELSFMGFACTDARIKQMYRQRYPDDRSMTNLESWSAFEPQFPDVFRDMYQFWCARNEVRNL
jgi:hypothetical protein